MFSDSNGFSTHNKLFTHVLLNLILYIYIYTIEFALIIYNDEFTTSQSYSVLYSIR